MRRHVPTVEHGANVELCEYSQRKSRVFVSHTLSAITESIRRDGFVIGMQIALEEVYRRMRFWLLECSLGPATPRGYGAGDIKLADSSWVDTIVSAWPHEFGRAKGDTHIRSKIATRFENGYPCLISERDGQLEGAVWCVPWQFDSEGCPARDRQDAFEICNLFVIPECRGRGIARRLVVQALSLMARRGKAIAYSRVLPERQASLALHLSTGFYLRGVLHCRTLLGHERRWLIPVSRLRHADVRGMRMNACVLLAQGAWGGTLEAIRSLGSRGVAVYVFVLDRDPKPYAASRYCREARRLDGRDAPSVTQELIGWCKTQKFSQRPLLIPMTDVLATLVAEQRQDLDEHFIVGAARPEIILNLLQKEHANSLASSCGLDVPESIVVKTQTDLETTGATMKYPVIAKPVWWREKGKATFKLATFETPESLIAKLPPVLDGSTSVLVQEYISGTDEDIEAFMFYRDRRGIVWGCTSRKLRQTPPGAGIMATGVAVDIPELRGLCTEFLNRIDYQGLGGIEFKQSATRRVYIETNVRPEAIHSLSRKAGLDLMWIAYCDYCLGGIHEEPDGQRPAFYLDWHAYWASYGLGNVIPWMANVLRMLCRQPLAMAVFQFRDPSPSFYLIKKSMRERSGRVVHKVIRRGQNR